MWLCKGKARRLAHQGAGAAQGLENGRGEPSPAKPNPAKPGWDERAQPLGWLQLSRAEPSCRGDSGWHTCAHMHTHTFSADCLAFLFLANQSSLGNICRSGYLSRSSLARSTQQSPKIGLQHYCCWRKKIISIITVLQCTSYAFYSISPPNWITKKQGQTRYFHAFFFFSPQAILTHGLCDKMNVPEAQKYLHWI